MKPNLLVFDSHPVQYRVPIWQEMNAQNPGCVHVVYASDCSVRGHNDVDFGAKISWDEPLLSGYNNTVLNCEKGEPLHGWKSLTGKGVKELLNTIKPDAVLLTGLNYRFDLVAYLHARLKGIPVWMRNETQDDAFERSRFKHFFRHLIYRIAYLGLDKAFFIGELNRKHYLRHGVSAKKLRRANYATVDRFDEMNTEVKARLRSERRAAAGIRESDFVIGFSGKFIQKKNPAILFEMLQYLPEVLRTRTALYFIGSGPLSSDLERLAAVMQQRYGVKTYFSGFVNQTQLPGHYLAMDVLILPSKRMGETWGLVANEAMQAGCSVIVSDAVGCSADFRSWERFKIFREGDPIELAERIYDLAQYPPDFHWASTRLKPYTIEATANSLLLEMGSESVES